MWPAEQQWMEIKTVYSCNINLYWSISVSGSFLSDSSSWSVCMTCSQSILICLCHLSFHCSAWTISLLIWISIFWHINWSFLCIYIDSNSTKWNPSNSIHSPSCLLHITTSFSFPFASVLRGLAVCTLVGQSPWISIWGCSCPHCSTRPHQSKWIVSSCRPGI